MEIEEFCCKYTVNRKNTNSVKWDTGIEKRMDFVFKRFGDGALFNRKRFYG